MRRTPRIVVSRLARAAGLAGMLLLGTAWPAWAAPIATPAIPWQPGVTFTRTSVDDDVRNVLRALVGGQGLQVVFRPGITGKVSFRYRDADPAAVLDQLLQENGLEAAYNPATRTVTFGPARGAAAPASQRLIPLHSVDFPSLRQMLVNFGIGTEGVTYDPTLQMIGVAGDAARVTQVSEVVKALEDHLAARQDRSAEDRMRQAVAQRSTLQRRAYEDAMNVQTRIFRLRFADVAPTTRTFHGRSVQVPGVLETLQAMLGLAPGSASVGTSQPLYAPFRPATPSQPPASLGAQSQALNVAAQALRNSAQANATLSGLAGALEGDDPMARSVQAMSRPTLSADQRTNSVIVRGSPAAIAAVEAAIEQLDQPVKMVQIEVVIATAQVGVSQELGIAFGARGRDLGRGDLSGSTNGIDPVSLLPIGLTPQGAVASFVARSGQAVFQAQLRALAERNKARVLSAPHLVTLDNVTARITRSEDLYVPVDTGGLNGQGLSQIQTGLTLEITPSIVPPARGSSEQMVRLNLNAVNSAPSANSARQISVRSQEVQTDVLVPDGGTFVIGGLFDDQRLQGRSGVPVLKDIPVLGALFREESSQSSLGETIFFITPRVVEQRDTLARDIAAGGAAGASATVAAGRRDLAGVAREMDGRGPPRRPVGRRAVRQLEEDE